MIFSALRNSMCEGIPSVFRAGWQFKRKKCHEQIRNAKIKFQLGGDLFGDIFFRTVWKISSKVPPLLAKVITCGREVLRCWAFASNERPWEIWLAVLPKEIMWGEGWNRGGKRCLRKLPALWSGFIKHGCPLIRPYEGSISWGVGHGGGEPSAIFMNLLSSKLI